MEDVNKLFSFRFAKRKKIMQIYKIIEIETNILLYFKTYKLNKSPKHEEKNEYLKKIYCAKEIINFKEREEKASKQKDKQKIEFNDI